MNEDVKNQIEGLIRSKDIFLFMKGTKEQPMCGFSAQVVHILSKHQIEFETTMSSRTGMFVRVLKSIRNGCNYPAAVRAK